MLLSETPNKPLVITASRNLRPLINELTGSWNLVTVLFGVVTTAVGGGTLSVIAALLLLLFVFLKMRNYYRKVPIIRIDKEKILFGSQCFYWHDVSQINLIHDSSGDQTDWLECEGVRFIFKNGEVKYMYDAYYTDSEKAKLFLEQVVYNQQDYFEIPAIVEATLSRGETFTTYKSNTTSSLTTVMLALGMIYLIVDLGSINSENILGYLFRFSFILSVALSMNYFLISDKSIVVRKNYFPWMKRIYSISDIKEVVIVKRYRIECLRIITRDFVNETFFVLGLPKEQWHAMQQQLKARGVQVTGLIDSAV
jgi:hypothetical protein